MAADRFLLACQLKINGLDEFRPYKEHLVAQRDKLRAALAVLKDLDTLRQYQGRVQQLDELLEELAQAPVLARKIGGA